MHVRHVGGAEQQEGVRAVATQNEVVEAVTVDVTGARDRIGAEQGEAVGAVEFAGVQCGGGAVIRPEHHMTVADGIADDDVVQPVAIDVTRGGDAIVTDPESVHCGEHETVVTVQPFQVDLRVWTAVAKDDVGHAIAEVFHRPVVGGNDHVVDAVAVEVADGGDRPTALSPISYRSQAEAVIAVEVRDIQAAHGAAVLAEHHVAGALL